LDACAVVEAAVAEELSNVERKYRDAVEEPLDRVGLVVTRFDLREDPVAPDPLVATRTSWSSWSQSL